jgi:CRP-like cAMP-binding protein
MSDVVENRAADNAPLHVPLWARRALDAVREDVAREMIAEATICSLPKGAHLRTTGEPGTAAFFIESGTVRVHVTGCEAWAGVALLGPGDLVGELAATYSAGRPVTVTCLEQVELACVPRTAFDAVQRLDPHFGANLQRMRRLAREATRSTFAVLRWLEVDRRVARELLALADSYGLRETDGSVRIPLRLTQQDLAILACASRERTNKALSGFRRRGWVHVDPGYRLTLARPDLLRKRLFTPAQ